MAFVVYRSNGWYGGFDRRSNMSHCHRRRSAGGLVVSPEVRQKDRTSSLNAAPAVPPALSLAAGMVAGAIGVGVAYPFDTIKTKMQGYSKASGPGATLNGPLKTAVKVLNCEGPAGFYRGVGPTMAGQALIKGVVFSTYGTAQRWFVRVFASSIGALLLSAAISGFVASFFVTPIERIKVVMQGSANGHFPSPLSCLKECLQRDGLRGFLTRGLGATVAREVPSYMLYFLAYDTSRFLLTSSSLAMAPSLISVCAGALAGMACWLPVYPIDVVKTNLQSSTDPGLGEGFFECALRLYRYRGVMIFWDGLCPKLVRAAVNHATTFYSFETLCTLWIRR